MDMFDDFVILSDFKLQENSGNTIVYRRNLLEVMFRGSVSIN